MIVRTIPAQEKRQIASINIQMPVSCWTFFLTLFFLVRAKASSPLLTQPTSSAKDLASRNEAFRNRPDVYLAHRTACCCSLRAALCLRMRGNVSQRCAIVAKAAPLLLIFVSRPHAWILLQPEDVGLHESGRPVAVRQSTAAVCGRLGLLLRGLHTSVYGHQDPAELQGDSRPGLRDPAGAQPC